MPGAVNNEDYSLIDISRGVYRTHPVVVPDGYATDIINFMMEGGIPTVRGSLTIRNTNSMLTTPYAFYSKTGVAFQPQPIDLPCANNGTLKTVFLSVALEGATANRSDLIGIIETFNPSQNVGRKLPAATLTGGITVYNQTVYAGSATGVIKLDVSNFPTTLGETTIPSSPNNLIKLVSHKSRLFGFEGIKNRLYFTDAPAVGALPETWNTTANFIDFNGKDGNTVIWDIISLNNYIYIFTDSGLFSLYTQGAPSNWVVRLINPDAFVSAVDCVVVKDNLMYYVNANGVFATDGFDFRTISQGLSAYFTGTYSQRFIGVKLIPFDDGLLVRLPPSSEAAFYTEWYYTKLAAIAWSRFDGYYGAWDSQVPLPVDYGPEWIADMVSSSYDSGGITNNQLIVRWYRTYQEPEDSTLADYKTFIYDYKKTSTQYTIPYRDAHLCVKNDGTPSMAIFRPISSLIETKSLVGSNMMRLKHFRDIILLVGSGEPYDLMGYSVFNGEDLLTPLSLLTQDTPGGTAHDVSIEQSLVKLGLKTNMAYSLKLKLMFTWTSATPIPLSSYYDMYRPSILALGYTTMIERGIPRSQDAGKF